MSYDLPKKRHSERALASRRIYALSLLLSDFGVRRSFDSGCACAQDDALREDVQLLDKLEFDRRNDTERVREVTITVAPGTNWGEAPLRFKSEFVYSM